MELEIEVKPLQNGITLIDLIGNLDSHTFDKLEDKINELVESDSVKLIADLSKLDTFSSAGAGVFISCLPVTKENSGDLVLLNPTKQIKTMLEDLGLTQLLSIFGDLDSAIQYFDKG